jgi:hypothetical protein
MARRVKLPDGRIGNFPDDMSDSEIESVLQKQFPPESKENPTEPPKSQDQQEHDAAVRYGIKDPLAGLANLGHGLLNAPHNIAALFSEKLASHIPKQDEFNYSEALGIPEDQKNLADKLIQFAPELGVSLGLPATRLGKLGEVIDKLPGWGKYLKAGLGNAISQGGFAATQSPEPGKAALEAGAITAPFSALSEAVKSGNPTVRNVGRVLGGLGAGGLGYYGAKSLGAPEPAADLSAILLGALGSRGGSTDRRVRENMLKGVEGTSYQEPLEASKRLGLTYITPAEASGNPFTGGVQGSIGKTEGGAKLLYEKGKERAGSEENAIENLFGNIFPKKLEERKNALYKSAEPIEVPEQELEKLKDNEIFKSAMAHVQREPAYREKLKGVPKNSIEYLNQIKEAMDDMIEKAPKKEAAIIRNTKNELTAVADKVSPEYKEARQLAERGIVRREIEDLFNKKDETGTNLFKSLLSNKRDYNDLQNKFNRLEKTASTPEQIESMKSAQQQLEDMKLIFGRLINVPTAKTAEALARGSMSKERSTAQAAMKYLQELLSGGKYDKAAVELITNPKWSDELDKLGEITKKDKLMAAFHNLLGKAAAQEIAQ